jgi:hypothetical protein
VLSLFIFSENYASNGRIYDFDKLKQLSREGTEKRNTSCQSSSMQRDRNDLSRNYRLGRTYFNEQA